jgi:squalene-hopene/tetraprenyl-beta-curcumene cyclase
MIDPPSADVTAHVVEMLGEIGVDRRHTAIERARDYLYQQQEPDGSWFGRWGVNHIYGTGAVLPALAAIGEPMDSVCVRRAVRWLVERQNHDGGFGEGCESYVVVEARGRGPSTPSQTAWALLALIAAGRAESPPARRAAAYLLDTQRPTGTWMSLSMTGSWPGLAHTRWCRAPRDDPGTELARGFAINYNLYRHASRHVALGRARRWLRGVARDRDRNALLGWRG